MFPFNFLSSNKNFLACCTDTDSNITQWKDLQSDNNSSLSLKPSSLVNHFNNATLENGNDSEKVLHPNTMTLMKCITLKYLTKINPLPYFI